MRGPRRGTEHTRDRCLARLDPDYRFNAVITEPPQRFALDSWLEHRAFLDELSARGWGYAEVYARTDARP